MQRCSRFITVQQLNQDPPYTSAASCRMSTATSFDEIVALATRPEATDIPVRDGEATGALDDGHIAQDTSSADGRPSAMVQNAWVKAALRRTRNKPSMHAFRALAMTDAVVDLASERGGDVERYAFAFARRLNEELRRCVNFAQKTIGMEKEQDQRGEKRGEISAARICTAADYSPAGVDVDIVAIALDTARRVADVRAPADALLDEGSGGARLAQIAQAVASAVDVQLRASDGTWPHGEPREWPGNLIASLPAAAVALSVACDAHHPLPPSAEAVRLVAARLRSQPKVLAAALQRAMEMRPTSILSQATRNGVHSPPAVWWRPLQPTMTAGELHARLVSMPSELLKVISEHLMLEGDQADAVHTGDFSWPEPLGLPPGARATAELGIAADGSVLLRSAKRRLPPKALRGATDELLASASGEAERKVVAALPTLQVSLGPSSELAHLRPEKETPGGSA